MGGVSSDPESSDPAPPGPGPPGPEPSTPAGPRPLREEEPFATLRAYPRRFGWGIPLVFLISIGAAFPLVGRSLSLAIAVQLILQTAGLLWLYVPALRKRLREEAEGQEEGELRREGEG